MKEMMTRIELGGVLGKTFGKVHHRMISRTQEAAPALAATIKGFEKYMISSRKRGLTFSVFMGKTNIGFDDLKKPGSGDVIRIVPVIMGSKRAGLLQTIVGVALIAIAIFAPWGSAIAGSNFVFQAGVAVALGGVVQMLSPQAQGLSYKDDSDNQPSYAFGQPTNTASQGYPVPLLYGQRRIGGAIVSAGIYVEDQQ